MAIHLLASVSGSPGVSTTAIAWATLATTPTLLLEADMTGGSSVLAGPFRGQVTPDQGVLALAQRPSELMREHLWWHTLELPGTQNRALPTVASPAQARSLIGIWPAIADAVKATAHDSGTDVVIDYGRLSTRNAATPLLAIADTIVILTSGTLASVNATARTLAVLREEISHTTTPERVIAAPVLPSPGMRLRGRAGVAARPWTSREIAPALAPTHLADPINYDPDAAAVYSAAAPTKRRYRPYNASVLALTENAARHADQMSALTGRSH